MLVEVLNNILLQFGYPPELWPNFSDRLLLPDAVDGTLSRLLTKIERIDTQLESALGESMAVQVGDLTVNYAMHTKLLKLEGSRTLNEISSLTSIPIKRNKYYGQGLICSML